MYCKNFFKVAQCHFRKPFTQLRIIQFPYLPRFIWIGCVCFYHKDRAPRVELRSIKHLANFLSYKKDIAGKTILISDEK